MKMTSTTIVAALVVGLLIGGEFTSQQGLPVAWAQLPLTPGNPAGIDPSLPGERQGMLTQIMGETVRIDGMTYRLAPGYVLAFENGLPFPQAGFQGKTVNFPVRYWLGSGGTRNQVTQLLVKMFR